MMSVFRIALALVLAVSFTTLSQEVGAVTLPTAGQVLHLDASDTASFTFSGSDVVTWADQSTSGNDASQATSSFQPTYVTGAMNGKPVVRFDGTDDYLGLLSTMNLTGGMELFIVAQNANGGDMIANGWQFSTPGGGFRILSNNGGNLIGQFGNSVASLTSAVSTPYSELVGLTYNDSVDDYALRRTGDLAASISSGNNYNVNSGFPSKIGASNNNTGTVINPFSGDIAEVLVYNQPLTTSDRQLVEGLLAYKWGLQSQLPVDHPFFNLDPNFVPEPSTFWLLGMAIGAGSFRRKKRSACA